MRRTVTVAALAAGLLLLVAPAALACKTSAWLDTGPVTGPGQPLAVWGGGFDAGTVELTWGSHGETLAEVDVAEDGTLSAEVEIPEHAAGRTPLVARAHHGDGAHGAGHHGEGSSPAHPAAWVDVLLPGGEAPAAAPTADEGQGPGTVLGPAVPATAAVATAAVAVAALGGTATAWRRRRAPHATAPGEDAPLEPLEPLEAELRELLEEGPHRTPVG